MSKEAKEFDSDSFSHISSIDKGNISNAQSDYNPNYIMMQISGENEEDENNKNFENSENTINENNNQEGFNMLEDNQNNNNNNINNINQENELNNFGNIQNLGTQNLNKINEKGINVPQPQSKAIKSTDEMTNTNIKIIFKESSSKIEIKNEEEDDEEEDENEDEEENEEEIKKIENKKVKKSKKGKNEHDIRNLYPKYVKRFFKDLVIFINRLIEKFNKDNNTNISYLESINGEFYIHNLKNSLYLLDRTVIQALSTRVELVIDEDGKEKQTIKISVNKDLCDSIYNEIDENKKIHNVIKVFNKTVRELMKIYNEDKHEDESYRYFDTFGDYVNTLKDGKKDKKEILIKIGKNYESILTKKIYDNKHTRGPKPEYQKEKNEKRKGKKKK